MTLLLFRREIPACAQQVTGCQKASVATGLGFELLLCVCHGRPGCSEERSRVQAPFPCTEDGAQRSRPKQAEGLVEKREKEQHLPLRPRAACAAPARGSGTQGTVKAARDWWCKSWQQLPGCFCQTTESAPVQTHPSPLTAAGNPGQALKWRLQQHMLLHQPSVDSGVLS